MSLSAMSEAGPSATQMAERARREEREVLMRLYQLTAQDALVDRRALLTKLFEAHGIAPNEVILPRT